MNKAKICLFIGAILMCLQMFDASMTFATANNVAERMDCPTMQQKISELSAVENPDDSVSAELKSLQERYRKDCSKSIAGRKTSTSGRATVTPVPVAQPAEDVQTVEVKTATEVLNEYLSKKNQNCKDLQKSMEVATGSTEEKAKLQNQYDADCAVEENDVSEDIEVVDEEQVAANIEAGLCADGSKPNRFGCCQGETFKDLGNLIFACCPDDGGDCYPPITTGDAL